MTQARLVITGAGVVSAAGRCMAALTNSLDRHGHCLTPIAVFDATGLASTHAGQVLGFDPLEVVVPVRVMTVDRGTQMALDAARQALRQAALKPGVAADTGVAVGTSGSPQYQNLRVFPDRRPPDSRAAALFMARSSPCFQADLVARQFGLGGPRFAFGSAPLGGLLALSHAMDLLRAEHASAMLVGGGEINTLMNALGMNMLGMTTAGPCMPFAGPGGMCFGEGAAFFVVERWEDAISRGADLLAELVGAGISADAYSDVAQDPTGRGLARAVRKSLTKSNADPASIGWVRASGTGQRDLDAAEVHALNDVFGGATPPVTSTEPYFGHVNGVSALLGLAAVVSAFHSGQAPSQPDASTPRQGLAVSLLQPGALPDGDCLLTATAFGGTNGGVVIRRAGHGFNPKPGEDACIVIAGMGAVSTFGGTVRALLHGIAGEPAGSTARLVDDAFLARKVPGLQLQRRSRLLRMTLLAVHDGMASAAALARGSDRFGLLVGLTRGPAAAHERFLEQTLSGTFDATTGRALLRTGRFSVASEIASAFGLLGYSGAMACGVHGGVQVLAHGAEILRASPDLDGLLVVAVDEWTGLLERQYRRLGLLRNGCAGGEGAAALLLRRLPRDQAPLAGCATIEATAFAGDTTIVPDPDGVAYGRTIRQALTRAGREIDFAIGQSCGWPAHDQRERAAFRDVCPETPLDSIVPHTGVVESAGGLFSAMAAVHTLHPRRNAMLIGSTERGAHAAVVLSRIAA
jgi:3-oxoacyl-(acyl-carrier-protein) synthase